MNRVAQIGLAAAVVAALLFAFWPGTDDAGAYATTAELFPALRELVAAENPEAALIVSVVGSPDFIQFSAQDRFIDIDFPMGTSRQQQLRPQIEAAGAALGVSRKIVVGADETGALDYTIIEGPQVAADVAAGFLQRVLEVTHSTPLTFQFKGYKPVTSAEPSA